MGNFFHLGPEEAWKSSAQSHPLNTNNSRYAVLWKIIHTTIAYQRLRGDLILVYKILNGYFTSDFDNLFTYSNNISQGDTH